MCVGARVQPKDTSVLVPPHPVSPPPAANVGLAGGIRCTLPPSLQTTVPAGTSFAFLGNAGTGRAAAATLANALRLHVTNADLPLSAVVTLGNEAFDVSGRFRGSCDAMCILCGCGCGCAYDYSRPH